MKIRLGFVPNSSSSSFIVNAFPDPFYKKGKKRFITKKQEEALIKAGFIKTSLSYPEQIDGYDFFKENKEEEKIPYLNYGYNYGCHVACNQADIIEVLIKYRIPFTASEHYNHYKLIYDGGDTIYQIPNYGNMYYQESKNIKDSIANLIVREGFEEINISHYMSKKDQKIYFEGLKNKKEKT